MTKLIWLTPNAEDLIVYMARVSNEESQKTGDNPDRLISYLIKNKHWSPFEMASACFEINAPRDIIRQMLRHSSFSFQEFSQRYAESKKIVFREARMQDQKNRQNSLETIDQGKKDYWETQQKHVMRLVSEVYKCALQTGLAKEVARAILPEGLTMSKLYMSGNIRSWLHYIAVRSGPDTQKEHRLIAQEIKDILKKELPLIFTAFGSEKS